MSTENGLKFLGKVVLFYTLCIAISCFLIYYLAYHIGYNEGFNDAREQETMCEVRFDNSSIDLVDGLYTTEGYFCVWTKDRTSIEIAETTFHELAHYYVDMNSTHFSKK